MFRYELNNTGYSPSLAPDDDTILWSKEFTYEIKSNPTIKDEKLYIVDNTQEPLKRGGDVYCLNAFTGEEIWKADQWDDEVWGSPTVANDKVYVLGIAYNLYCYDANNGDLLWEFEAYGHCSPMIFEDKVYFGSYSGGFYCLNATTGEKIWEFDTSTTYSGCTPAIVDGKVYTGSDYGILYCLDADTGSKIWGAHDRGYWGSPAFYEDKIYIGYDKLYCLNADTGEDVWSVELEVGNTHCSPAVAYGNVYIDGGGASPTGSGKIYCYDANNGDWIWTSPLLGNSIWNGFAVADGKLYTCSNNLVGEHGKFNCLDAYTGDIIWQFEFIVKGQVSSPAVAYGNVYIGSGDDKILYAFGTPNEPPEIPTKPYGPDEGMVGLEYTFNSSTTDPEDDNIYYLFDWGDGTNSGWQGPYASGVTVNASHMWTHAGDYEIRAKAHDGRRESNWSEALIITIENDPPGAPTITGETNGKAETEYEYTFNAVDPDDHDVKYFIDWGDDNTEWTGYNTSGTDVKIKHTWREKGTYNIASKAKDEFGVEGPEGTLEVTMPKNKALNFNNNLLIWLFERFPNAFPILRHMLGL
ncbi:WD40-like repeat-containing protein [Thermoplasmatales archaeon SCGC AB-540-F20]|nr:WD40-like repeat-containing protein [Thermoplasmatales archaeon SCGC AB-540-F20]